MSQKWGLARLTFSGHMLNIIVIIIIINHNHNDTIDNNGNDNDHDKHITVQYLHGFMWTAGSLKINTQHKYIVWPLAESTNRAYVYASSQARSKYSCKTSVSSEIVVF